MNTIVRYVKEHKQRKRDKKEIKESGDHDKTILVLAEDGKQMNTGEYILKKLEREGFYLG